MFRNKKLFTRILIVLLLSFYVNNFSYGADSTTNISLEGSDVILTFPKKIYIPKNCANWKYTFVNNGGEKLSIFVILETLGGEEIDRNGAVGVANGIAQTDSIRVCAYQFPKRKKGKTYSMNLNLRVAEYSGANNIFTKKIKAFYK